MRPDVHTARKKLPGRIRQQVKRTVDELSQNPRPSNSQVLTLPEQFQTQWEARRIRIENWRIIYAINENWGETGVLTIQKRPPYDYEDLETLLSELSHS